jgi:hypothetical protein
MARAYGGCYLNLTGSPVCGSNVTNMSGTYSSCNKLTGSPVCGSKVTDMSSAYFNCANLTGSPACGSNVTNMAYAYYNCGKLDRTNIRFLSKNITNVAYCLAMPWSVYRCNIHVYKNSTTLKACLSSANKTTLVGNTVSWTNAGSYYYNSSYSLYIYPDL